MYISKFLIPALIVLGALQNVNAADWSYSGENGPQNWGKLEPGFAQCSIGKRQSPIDLTNAEQSKNDPLRFHYSTGQINQFIQNQNLYFKVKPATIGYVEFDGEKFQLDSFHFHVPSEHTIDGKRSAMELHLVHVNNAKQLLVVGFLIKEGTENTTVKKLFAESAEKIKNNTQNNFSNFDPTTLLPKSKTYYNYPGSLTTPPCSENVTWIVFKEPLEISANDIKFFKDNVTEFNSRELQPLNQRKIFRELQ